MSASPSSSIDPAIGYLVELAANAAKDRPGLLEVLARVADPRHRRGVRYRLAAILGLALCAVVAGARSFTAIAEWAADADEQTLGMPGVTGAVARGAGVPPYLAAPGRGCLRRGGRCLGTAGHQAGARTAAGHCG